MASINDLATAAIASSAAALSSETAALRQSSGANGPKAEPARGALICLEGLDRSGKTTQVKLLEQRFVELGKKVKVMRFPGEWPPTWHWPADPRRVLPLCQYAMGLGRQHMWCGL